VVHAWILSLDMCTLEQLIRDSGLSATESRVVGE